MFFFLTRSSKSKAYLPKYNLNPPPQKKKTTWQVWKWKFQWKSTTSDTVKVNTTDNTLTQLDTDQIIHEMLTQSVAQWWANDWDWVTVSWHVKTVNKLMHRLLILSTQCVTIRNSIYNTTCMCVVRLYDRNVGLNGQVRTAEFDIPNWLNCAVFRSIYNIILPNNIRNKPRNY